MLSGEKGLAAGVFTTGGLTSAGPCSVLVVWPGGPVTEAERLGIRVVPIASLL
jgi:hypothetical protein